MNEREFCYWLQGFAELNGKAPTEKQWKSVQDHLALVFKKATPPLQQIRQTGLITDQLARSTAPPTIQC